MLYTKDLYTAIDSDFSKIPPTNIRKTTYRTSICPNLRKSDFGHCAGITFYVWTHTRAMGRFSDLVWYDSIKVSKEWSRKGEGEGGDIPSSNMRMLHSFCTI